MAALHVKASPTSIPRHFKFSVDEPIIPVPADARSPFREFRQHNAHKSPLAALLLEQDHVQAVLIGPRAVVVKLDDDKVWPAERPHLGKLIKSHIESGKPVILGPLPDQIIAALLEALPHDEANEAGYVTAAVELVMDKAIRPGLQADGGDADVLGVVKRPGAGYVVTLSLRGACSGCAHSTTTLQNFVLATLKKHIPLVDDIENV
jgi:Fe-S cluster biogenesis protein NfuA